MRGTFARAVLVAALALAMSPAACGRSRPSDVGITGTGGRTDAHDGGSGSDADSPQRADGAAVPDAPDAPGAPTTEASSSCLDQPPTELPRPPAGRLPCNLIPPGLML